MFPKHFYWGAATSSHQVEGNNILNDWWQWEKSGHAKDVSGEAAGHYEHFDSDFQIARELHHNAHRFSIEWSRIEPKEGLFNQEALDHYKAVLTSLHKNNLTPIVTLHHFTNPKWFSDSGGWLQRKAHFYFTRYAKKVAESLGKNVSYWITLNEPMILTYLGYLMGNWPPGKHSVFQMVKATEHLIQAHQSSYQQIHKTYKENNWPASQVGIAKNCRLFKVCPKTNNFACRLSAGTRHQLFNLYFLNRIKNQMDFLGVNYYEREYLSNDKTLGHNLFGVKCNYEHRHVKRVNQLGWDSAPEGLFEILTIMARYNKPMIITENGTCEDDDRYRWEFIESHVLQVQKAIENNIPVFGYLYWSLLDNFEWHHGFGPRFGIIDVDYKTLKRRPRPSAYQYRDLIDSLSKH